MPPRPGGPVGEAEPAYALPVASPQDNLPTIAASVVSPPPQPGYGPTSGGAPTGSYQSYGSTGSYAQPVSSYPAHPTSSFPAASPPYSVPPVSANPPSPRRGGRLGAVAMVLAVLLLLVAGGQSYLIYQLDNKVSDTNGQLKKSEALDRSRMDEQEKRLKELERKAGANLNTADVAASVLPSVFRVSTKTAIGTAFAFGKKPDSGTDLITNYHVVADYYKTGGRDVDLRHGDQLFKGKIAKVNQDEDLALIHTDETFVPLQPAPEPPKVGEGVLVVGAPFGLTDSVSAGVISTPSRVLDGKARVQFDAPINPGNSGGPVINAQKQVIGVASAKAAEGEGISLGIPIQVVCDQFKIC